MSSGDDGATIDYPQIMDANLGAPCGPIDTSQGPLYFRTYHHGIAAVNATAASTATPSLALPCGTFRRWGGAAYDVPVGSTVGIAYQAGLVLQTASDLCPSP